MRTRFYVIAALVLVGLTWLATGPPAQAQGCRYVLGFEAIYTQAPDVVGPCKTNEQYDPNGNAQQQTANGMMEWRKADNFTAFTDGYRSWVNGPCGLEMRLNSERFAWEANPEGLPVAVSRCGGAAGIAQSPAAPPAAAPPAAPSAAKAIGDNLQTWTDGDFTALAVRRVPPPPPDLTGAPSKRVDESVVQLVRRDGDGYRLATGTSVGGDGRTILTAFHFVGDLETGKLDDPLVIGVGPYLGYRLRADVVATDAEHDLAVLHVKDYPGFGGFNSLPLANSDAAQPGEPIYVYSYPFRMEGGVARTSGSVLIIWNRTSDGQRDQMLTEATVAPGSSGGVAVNGQGEVLGIVTFRKPLTKGIDRAGLPTITQFTGFVPIHIARPLLAQAGVQ